MGTIATTANRYQTGKDEDLRLIITAILAAWDTSVRELTQAA